MIKYLELRLRKQQNFKSFSLAALLPFGYAKLKACCSIEPVPIMTIRSNKTHT